MSRIIKTGSAEFRFSGPTDMDLDELCIYDAAGKCVLHLEVMSDTGIFIGVYPNGDRTGESYTINQWSTRGHLKMRCQD